MADHTACVLEAQVDWVTCSAHSEDRSLALDALADDLLRGAEALGNERSGWRSMGYIGTSCGQFQWGRRDDRQSILRVTGGAADEHLAQALAVSDYVSRLDVAVTWRAVPPDPHLGQNAYSLAELRYRERGRAAMPSATMDAAGGYTCYLGDRRSPYYARIYNKEAERASRQDDTLARHYAGCWRYEVEAHDSRAVALASQVVEADARPAYVQQWLWEWFEQRGVPPAFPASGAAVLAPGFHRRSDDESKLRHLARNVAPTLKGLRQHGRYDDARVALGLDSSNLTLTRLERLLRS